MSSQKKQNPDYGFTALLDNLSAHLVHEMNNLLSGVTAHAEVGKMESSDDSVREKLDTILEATDAAAELSRDFLDFVQVDENRKTTDGRMALQRVLTLFDSMFALKNVELDCRLPANLPPVAISSRGMELVLANLLKNALEAARLCPDPTVRLEANHIEETVCFRIWNSGPAIPEEDISRLSEPFFSDKADENSTGLGLTLVQQVVHRSGGGMSVRNGDDGGVEVRLRLPASGSSEGPPISQTSQNVSEMADSGDYSLPARVLVVEDEETARRGLEVMLNEMSCSVIQSCKCGSDALRELKDDRFDIVLLDLRMPDVTGEEVYEQLPDYLRKRVIFVTGDVMNSERTEFITEASQPSLLKPIRYDELKQVIGGLTQGV